MAGINAGKVIVGGLVAGLVGNIGDFVTNFLFLQTDYTANAERLHLDPAAMTAAAATIAFVVVDFIFGIVLVFAYAAMRPRFGPGPKTAIMAGLVPYVAVFVVLYGFTVGGMMTMSLYVKSSACALVTVMLASLAGGAVYNE
jgi:hypothetical protein